MVSPFFSTLPVLRGGRILQCGVYWVSVQPVLLLLQLICETCMQLPQFDLHSEPSPGHLFYHWAKNKDAVYWTCSLPKVIFYRAMLLLWFLNGKSRVYVTGALTLLPEFWEGKWGKISDTSTSTKFHVTDAVQDRWTVLSNILVSKW